MNTGSIVPRTFSLACSRVHASICACGLVAALLPLQAAAQDSAFLACERFSDRGQRIACLEDALEAATAAEENDADPAAPAIATPSQAPQPAASADKIPPILERLRNFGRDESAATLSTDAEGQDRLHDTVASLEKRRDAWIVTLAGGQVWMQDYPRALALREGDAVTIYRAGFGNGYRLSTERLSGFIRVKRVR